MRFGYGRTSDKMVMRLRQPFSEDQFDFNIIIRHSKIEESSNYIIIKIITRILYIQFIIDILNKSHYNTDTRLLTHV